MEKSITFSGLEEILRTAIKLSSYHVKDLASVAGLSKSGMYCFTSGQNHISIEKGDLLINYLKENDSQSLNAAIQLYLNN